MRLENISEVELLKKSTLKYIVDNDKETEFRLKAKELRVVGTFDKMLKTFKRKHLEEKKEKYNFCNFDEKYSNVCTGEWVTSEDGIYRQEADYETNEIKHIEASRMMILPTETYRNVDTGIEKIKLSFHKYDNWNGFVADKITISNINKIVELSNFGIDVNSINSRDLIKFLYDVLTLNDNTIIPHFPSISRLGWVDNEFMPYCENIKFDGEVENKYTYDSIKQKGDYSKWVKYTEKLRENKLLKIQMATSFASPLVEKVNALPFICHLWGGTGSGKTVGMMVAMSIWGNPAFGALTKTMNMTANSMMSTCAFLKNLPFAGDELQMIVNRFDNYDNLVMKVCEGVDRGRMKYDTNSQTRTWKNTFLFTGEEPITKENSGGGVKNRVIEINCNGQKVVENGNAVVNFLGENYGLVAKDVIDAINSMDIYVKYKDILAGCIDSLKITEKQAMAISLIILGDYIAEKYIYKTNNFLTYNDFKEYSLTGEQVSIGNRAYKLVMNFISKNSSNFSETGRETWGKITDADILINRSVLYDFLKSEKIDLNAVLQDWDDSGYCFKNSQGKYSHNTKCFGVKGNYIRLFNSEEVDESPF